MSAVVDPEIRRVLLEEARDRLRTIRRGDRSEALLAVHSLAASAASSGMTDLLAWLTGLDRRLAEGDPSAIDRVLGEIGAAIERTAHGEDDRDELLECFAVEAAEHLDAMDRGLDRLAASPLDAGAQEELYRVLHTFKGAAGTVGKESASRGAHMLEEMLERVREGARPLDRPLHDLLRAGTNLLRAMVMEPERADDHRRALAALAGAHGAVASRSEVSPPPVPRRRPERRREAPLMLRVPLERTRELVVDSREVAKASRRVGASTAALRGAFEDVHAARAELLALTRVVPAEAAHRLDRLATDLAGAASAVDLAARELDEDGARIARAAGRARRFVEGLRTTPASWLFDRLVAVAEEAAQRLDKAVAVEVEGEEVEIDRDVAGRVLDPLLHLVRNAVAHGCEVQAQRVAVGKSPSGRLLLAAAADTEQVEYSVQDDGPGIDLESVRERLIRTGVRAVEEVEAATEEQLLEWIFLSGVSTRPRADELSGRGVGLDAVRAGVSRLCGTVSVSTRRGEGTRFVVRVPRGGGRLRVVRVGVGAHRLGLPLESVRRIEALPPGGATGGRLLTDEGDLALSVLAARLGLRRRPGGRSCAVVLEGGDGPCALEVDRVLGVTEVTAHGLGGLLEGSGPYSGVGVDGDGAALLLLDVARLVGSDQTTRVASQVFRVLVADDSRTVRALVVKALRGAGYEVESAADGFDAWMRLQAERYDLLVTDLEMPRLGGRELVERVRADPRMPRLPIVVLTSRVGDGPRRWAGSLGVAAFISKPVGGPRLVREVEEALRPR